MIIDDIRARYPGIAGALYFYEPGKPVTLEMINPDGDVFSFSAPTVAECVAKAFPELTDVGIPISEPEPTEPQETPVASVFD